MDLTEFLDALNSGAPVEAESPARLYMHAPIQTALKLTAACNSGSHTPEQVRETFSRLIGKPVDAAFRLFPPFHAGCGKIITLGKGVIINSGQHFQDQGGIAIGKGVWVAANAAVTPGVTVGDGAIVAGGDWIEALSGTVTFQKSNGESE